MQCQLGFNKLFLLADSTNTDKVIFYHPSVFLPLPGWSRVEKRVTVPRLVLLVAIGGECTSLQDDGTWQLIKGEQRGKLLGKRINFQVHQYNFGFTFHLIWFTIMYISTFWRKRTRVPTASIYQVIECRRRVIQ